MHSIEGIIAMNEQAAQQRLRKGPKSAEEWDLGLTILEQLIIKNNLQGECISRECIAEVMGISAQAVENLELRAFKKLRRLTSHLRPELEDMGVVQRLSRKLNTEVKSASHRRRDSEAFKSRAVVLAVFAGCSAASV